ncbi:hypothetical protein AXG93_809s1050 [Marchantia polymorpha subsp. ruderalis]|uniref:Reverse transcriptase Ty1/copia-type domain-containing protein n=1 Tax=Marchantia polymorpha subsp. ruderalis TaxID=1480154 RepID=A0A176WHF9_MARPO|nr:hypothetical protein AXG93_809s1050 [Marchantia polymorpha subsp. ruderalis]
MEDEFSSLKKNHTWTLTELPAGKNVVGCKWIYKIKYKPDGSGDRYKAKLVAKGYSHVYGVDFSETFFLVVKMTSIRVLMALAAQYNLELHQMDVKTAILNGRLHEEVYMVILEGLKVSFEKNKIKEKLKTEFKMVDLEDIHHCLGMQVDRNREEGWIRISQPRYLVEKLARFNMADCKPIDTPMEPGLKLSTLDSPNSVGESEEVKNIPYQAAVGSLTWAMVTRSDISFAVSSVAQFMSNLGLTHWKLVKRIFRYLRGILDFGLVFTRVDKPSGLTGYSDADWGGCLDTRLSTSGYCFQLNGGTISWISKKQKSVTLSSIEAEYMALSKARAETMWLRELLTDLGFELESTTIFCDNQSAISQIENHKYHKRSKHIDIRYHFVRDLVTNNLVKLVYVPTEEMIADVMTKPLAREKQWYHSQNLGLLVGNEEERSK